MIKFVKVNIKWKGKSLENIKIAEGQEVSSLKRVIEETCGIPVKKQKLLFKGNILKVKLLLPISINFLKKYIE